MSKYLMARVIEGTDNWYKYDYKYGLKKFAFSEIKNESLAIGSQCTQKGYDTLYSIGKLLWDNGMCTKFEIAAFDGDNLFWKTRPDQLNFEQNRYEGCFDSMIEEEYRSYSSEDFQKDKLEMDYIIDYQNRFWSNKNNHFGPDAFGLLLKDTKLHEDLTIVHKWLNSIADPELDETLRNCGFKYRGQFIVNPFYDETLRFEVDPLSYYGMNNVKGYLQKAKELIVKQNQPSKQSHINTAPSLDALISNAKAISDRGAHNSPNPYSNQKHNSNIEK